MGFLGVLSPFFEHDAYHLGLLVPDLAAPEAEVGANLGVLFPAMDGSQVMHIGLVGDPNAPPLPAGLTRANPLFYAWDPGTTFLLGLWTLSSLTFNPPRAIFAPGGDASPASYRIAAHTTGQFDRPELGAGEYYQVFDVDFSTWMGADTTFVGIPLVSVSALSPDGVTSSVTGTLLQDVEVDGQVVHVLLAGPLSMQRAVPGTYYAITVTATTSTSQGFEAVTDAIYCPAES
jgi:hypothetical protein